jgi:SAM-dependent methyltransferase
MQERGHEHVQEYYDRNTRRFIAYGVGSQEGAIHRALWAPGVTTLTEATNWVHELIASEIKHETARRGPNAPDDRHPLWLDLGCGVGGSLSYLSRRVSACLAGMTISPLQKEIADQRLRAAGTADPPHVAVGDFCEPTPYRELLASSDLAGAYMIESFLHAARPDELFRLLTESLVDEGMVIICDDFLTPHGADRAAGAEAAGSAGNNTAAGSGLRRREERFIEEFRRGWRAGSLMTVEACSRIAGAAGFTLVRDRDLTDYIQTDRPRDRLIGAVVALGRPLRPGGAWWDGLMGGNALQECLKRGLVAYRFLVFRKNNSQP